MIELLWNNPISEAKMAKYIDLLNLAAGACVLDVGTGCGEVLIRLHERYQIEGVGIDNSPPHIAEAKRRAKGRVTNAMIRFEEANAENWTVKLGSQDAVVCLGATHVFGVGNDAYANSLSKMRPMLKDGGVMVVGEGYMKQPASTEYRQLLGDGMPDHMTHAHAIATAQGLGLTPVAAWTSSLEEWDDFEWGYQQIVERNAEEKGEAALAKLRARREWMDAYLRWGRETLGFGVYIFRKAESQQPS